jgi:hypothetical protein
MDDVKLDISPHTFTYRLHVMKSASRETLSLCMGDKIGDHFGLES